MLPLMVRSRARRGVSNHEARIDELVCLERPKANKNVSFRGARSCLCRWADHYSGVGAGAEGVFVINVYDRKNSLDKSVVLDFDPWRSFPSLRRCSVAAWNGAARVVVTGAAVERREARPFPRKEGSAPSQGARAGASSTP